VYWLPTTTDFRNDELPAHPCFEQVSVAEQLVRSHFSRRLITMQTILPFTPERRMKRRNKETDPPPKYANLKDSILALSEEGPDMNGLEFASAAAPTAAAASGDAAAPASAAAAEVDLAVAFAPRPLSVRSQKRLAKAESIRLLRQGIIEANGGKVPSRKERAMQRLQHSTSEWENMQREKNKQVQIERARKQREAWQASQAAAAGTTAAAAAPAADVASSSPAAATMSDEPAGGSSSSAPAAAAADAAAPGTPPSPDGPPAKKARHESAA
jgi:hypothetical protein